MSTGADCSNALGPQLDDTIGGFERKSGQLDGDNVVDGEAKRPRVGITDTENNEVLQQLGRQSQARKHRLRLAIRRSLDILMNLPPRSAVSTTSLIAHTDLGAGLAHLAVEKTGTADGSTAAPTLCPES